jgi:L-lactate dehydrogenase complex protein LldG
MPPDARSEILSAIQSAIGRTPDPATAERDYQTIPRTYLKQSTLSQAQTIALLAERLLDYNAHVHSCPRGELPQGIAAALNQHDAHQVLIPPDLPPTFLPPGFDLTPDHNDFSPLELDRFDAAVTLCTLGIAETGTLILQRLPGQGRRAVTLVPDLHLCILHTADVVATVPEAFARLAAQAAQPLTFVSGPSATADIEMTRIKGVHGPRQLHVFLLARAPADALHETL